MPRVQEERKCKRCKKLFHRHNGNVKAKYCSRLCACRDRNTKKHQRIAGKEGGRITGEKTRRTGTRGYIKVNQRHEHRSVAEKKLQRKLKLKEIVHHKDGDKHNNNPENLEVMTRSEHIRVHLHKK